MIIDFRRQSSAVPPTLIHEQAVKVVPKYKTLRTLIDDKFTFDAKIDAVCAKANQRMHFDRKHRSFNVNTCFMKMFHPVLLSLCLFLLVWFQSLVLN